MSGEIVEVEQLENGLQAAFVHLPHFRTHSARLTVNAGSAHEVSGEYGAAHFLEHVSFRGTDTMPTEAEVHYYAEERGLRRNAETGQTSTIFVADGYELETVASFVSQVALRPTLTDGSLEGERNPIIDEIRGLASKAGYFPAIRHNFAIRGKLYSRPVEASPEDTQNMSPDAIRAFHSRHYKLSNAVLVLCSAESVERQREVAETLLDGYKSDDTEKPQRVDFDDFNPGGLPAALEQIDRPLTDRTIIGISYGLPETTSVREQLNYKLISLILSRATHSRLRRELALCYGAGAGVSRQADLSFGRNKNWSHFSASTGLAGQDSLTALNTMYDDVLHQDLPQSIFESILIGFSRETDHLMQSPPELVADKVRSMLGASRRTEVGLSEIQDFAANVSLASLREIHRSMVGTKPLIQATSPDPTVLASIGEWASLRV
ncbi:MAG: insulinase family protein [Candidatus Saccharimonadales bacterium]